MPMYSDAVCPRDRPGSGATCSRRVPGGLRSPTEAGGSTSSWDRSWDLGGTRRLCHPSCDEQPAPAPARARRRASSPGAAAATTRASSERVRQGRAGRRQADRQRDGRRASLRINLDNAPADDRRPGPAHVRRPDAHQRPGQAAVARLEDRLQLRLQRLHEPRRLDRQQRLHQPRRRRLRDRRDDDRAHQPERGARAASDGPRRGRARPARPRSRASRRPARPPSPAPRRRATRARSTSTRRSTRSRASSASCPPQTTGGQSVPQLRAHARAARSRSRARSSRRASRPTWPTTTRSAGS